MQKIISQVPQLTSYLARVPKFQHFQAVKQLIRIGLEASNSFCCKENRCSNSNVLRRQIDSLKQNIQDLSNMVRHQNYNYCRCCQPARQHTSNVFQTEPLISKDRNLKQKTNQFTRFQKRNQQKPVKDGGQIGTINFTKNQSVNPFSKNKSLLTRHHLDDTGARQALTFPPQILVENDARGRQKSSSYRKHVYQEEINKEEIGKIKQDKGQSVDKLKRDRTISDYSKATSKIKTLIEKDRIRFTQRKRDQDFQEGFNKYEYSDQNQMEQSSMHQEVAKTYEARLEQPHFAEPNTYDQHFQSSFKASNPASSSQKSNNRASSKKQFQRSKNQISSKLQASLGDMRQDYSKQSGGSQKYQKQDKSGSQKYGEDEIDEDDDVISNSSSFSQFSMEGSRRKQVGKISRRSQND